MTLHTTPLHFRHLQLGARMGPFAGYDMPISYDSYSGGMIKEHLAVRQGAGIFDVSHMGEFWVRGPEATAFVSAYCTRPFESVKDGRAVYALLLRDDGGILDDIIVYKVSSQAYWIVVNASNREKNFKHLKSQAARFQIELTDVSDETALIALQGPKAKEILPKIYPGCESLKYYTFEQRPTENPKKTGDSTLIVSRTGYTGEDGFEIFLPPADAGALWDRLLEEGAKPIGLGARDTLRLEAGFPLYGHELSEDLLPAETLSAFAWATGHDYCGKSATLRPPRYVAIAVKTDSPKPLRAEQPLYFGEKKVGYLTSGSMSPVLRVGIGLALVGSEHEEALKRGIFELDSTAKPRQAFCTEIPFVEAERTKKPGRKK